MTEAMLSLGSVIKVKVTKGEWMIVGRGTIDEQNQIWSYTCVPHPAGLFDITKLFSLSADQVQDVVFEGYSTPSSAQIAQITADFIDGKIQADDLEAKFAEVDLDGE